uniref:ZP domain-containing protein n=1 Tax=Oncorhynchus tshawytscha TaxID=74940 RepID=A0AAZ3SXA2_ONCTS
HGSSSDNARLTTSNADTRHHNLILLWSPYNCYLYCFTVLLLYCPVAVSNSLILAMALTQGKSIVVVSFTGSVVTSCEACHPHATCLASLLNNEVEVESSSFKLVTCNCKSGFVGNGITCYDLKLCAGGSCCHQGYSWSTELGCVDVDECSLPDQPCSPPQVCENTPRSFNCLGPPEDDLHFSPGDSRSVQFQCGGRQCPVGEDCISVGGTSYCADPCQHYTVLNDAWRSTNNNGNVNGEHCDQSINWQGWYRLFLGDTSVQMPERCVERYMCGTAAPMWLTEPHPQLLDGVVQRGVCGHWFSECCHFRENPIHVKACYGNYYVYKFVPPTQCNLAYCAGIVQCSDDKINWRCERKDQKFIHISLFCVFLALELVCGRNFIQVGLQMVNLEAGRLDPSSGHLADPSCSAHQEANGTVWYQVERREGRCGNTLETNSTHAVYSNSLFDESVSYLVASCSPFDRTEGVSGLGAKAESFMSLYRNANFTEAYPPGEVLLPVGSALHVGVSVDETYDQLVVVLENCYATHTPNFDDLMRYVLIQNRSVCAFLSCVRVEESGSSLRARFSALLFLYQGDYRDVFLHCRLSLCDQRSSSCTPHCNGTTESFCILMIIR